MSAALLLAASEPELERHLPEDGFRLVPPHGRFDLVLAGDVSDVDRWARRAPGLVLGAAGAGAGVGVGAAEADVVDCVHAFRRGCDDYVPRPFDYQELVERIRAVLRRSRPPVPEVAEADAVGNAPRTRDC